MLLSMFDINIETVTAACAAKKKIKTSQCESVSRHYNSEDQAPLNLPLLLNGNLSSGLGGPLQELVGSILTGFRRPVLTGLMAVDQPSRFVQACRGGRA